MFRLRPRSWDAFRRRELEDFESRLMVHLRKVYPRAVTTSDETLRDLIRHGVERARSYSIKSERAVCLNVDVMWQQPALSD